MPRRSCFVIPKAVRRVLPVLNPLHGRLAPSRRATRSPVRSGAFNAIRQDNTPAPPAPPAQPQRTATSQFSAVERSPAD